MKNDKLYLKKSLNVAESLVLNKHPRANKDKIKTLANDLAIKMTDDEINKPTLLKKVVVENFEEHREVKGVIESSDTFLQWYDTKK